MTAGASTPGELVSAARQVLDGQLAAGPGLWPRAVALLARQALEDATRSLWTGRYEAARDCPLRHQFLCAGVVLGDPLAREAHQTWAALSRACHVHSYELSPVAGELRGWIEVVERVVVRAAENSTMAPAPESSAAMQ